MAEWQGYGGAGQQPPAGGGPQHQGPPPHQGPQHQHPPYQGPQHADPYGGRFGYPQQVPGMNVMAVLALVLAFTFAPVGLVLGLVARRQIQRTGEEGEGLATAGAIIGGIFTALGLVVIVIVVVAYLAAGTS